MKIYLDNIIFYLQKVGGISVYWYELARRSIRSSEEVFFIEPNRNSQNIFRKKLNLGIENTETEFPFPFFLRRYLPLFSLLPKEAIFHSSYYRIAKQQKIINIVTVHDFTY
ncbi:MAG: glycosyltransferase family 1 protein, partial [Desulfobacteraceae bacterium]|nr:glycosyltransferase family 1 protein [Desulfobacteraceae bacterium]